MLARYFETGCAPKHTRTHTKENIITAMLINKRNQFNAKSLYKTVPFNKDLQVNPALTCSIPTFQYQNVHEALSPHSKSILGSTISLHVLPMSAQVYSGCSAFLQYIKHTKLSMTVCDINLRCNTSCIINNSNEYYITIYY